MDEFVSRTLKQLGKDFFLTEFNVNNPTNAPIDFELFNSNALFNTPTNQTLLPPSVPTTLYTFVGIPYGMAINTLTNTLYVVDGTNNVLVFNLSNYALITTLVGGAGGQYTAIEYDSSNNIMLITSLANPIGVVELNCSTNAFTNQTLPSGLTITALLTQQPNYYNSVFNPTNQNLYIPTESTTTPTRFLTKYNAQTNSYSGNVNLGNIPAPNSTPNDFSNSILANNVTSLNVIVNNLLYVLVSSGIEIYNLTNGSLISSISLPIDALVQNNLMVYSPTNNSIYLTVLRSYTPPAPPQTLLNTTELLQFDCSSNSFVGYVNSQQNGLPLNLYFSNQPITNTTATQSMVFVNSNDSVWIGNQSGASNSITVWELQFPLAPNNVFGTVVTSGIVYSMAYSSVSNTVCIGAGNNLEVYDVVTYTLITTVIGAFTSIPLSMVYRASNNSMYIADLGAGLIRIFDCTTNTIVGSLNPAVGNLSQLQYNPNNDKLYGTCTSSIVYCYDFATTTFSNIIIPNQGNQMALSLIQNKLYVSANGFGSAIMVVDTNTNTYVSFINVPTLAIVRDMEYDQQHDVVYYCASIFANPLGRILAINCQNDTTFFTTNSNSGIAYKLVYTYNATNVNNANRICTAVNANFNISQASSQFGSTPIYNSLNNTIYFINIAVSGNYFNQSASTYETYYIDNLDCSTNNISQYWTGLVNWGTTLNRYSNKYNGIAFNDITNTLFIPNSSSILNRFDCSVNAPLINLSPPLSATTEMDCLFVSPNKVYFIYNYRLFYLDCNTNIFSFPISLGATSLRVMSMCYNNLDNLLHILIGTSASPISIVTLDVATNTIVNTITTPSTFVGSVNQYQILYYSNVNSLFVVNNANGTFYSLFSQNGQFATYCPTNNSIYLGSNNNSNQVRVYDCSTDLLVATITTNSNPIQCAYNSLTNEMYVTCSTGFVDVINCSTNTVVTSLSIPTSSPYSIAYNSQLNLMYVTDLNNNTVINIDCS